jgi:hypothetical protein
MKPTLKPTLFAIMVTIAFSGCLTSKKFDHFVSGEYGDQLPQPDKKKKTANVDVNTSLPSDAATISSTQSQTKVLPLIVYWKIDYRHVCTLNPAIAMNSFTKTVNSNVAKGLAEKLNGRKLELTVQQVPSIFSLVEKDNVIWLIYAIHWSKVYVQPDIKSLIVNYKLYDTNGIVKNGTITINNTEESKNLRFFQSWKSAVSEYLSDYETNVTAMSKALVNRLTEEL